MNTQDEMARNIAVADDVYEMLSKEKRDGESFSDVIRRLARRRRSILEFAGAWADIPDEEVREVGAAGGWAKGGRPQRGAPRASRRPPLRPAVRDPGRGDLRRAPASRPNRRDHGSAHRGRGARTRSRGPRDAGRLGLPPRRGTPRGNVLNPCRIPAAMIRDATRAEREARVRSARARLGARARAAAGGGGGACRPRGPEGQRRAPPPLRIPGLPGRPAVRPPAL